MTLLLYKIKMNEIEQYYISGKR